MNFGTLGTGFAGMGRGGAGILTRPNLILKPQAFDDAAWTKTLCSISANAVAAPDGTTTADTIIEAATGSTQRYVTQAPTIPSGATITLSGYGKANTRNEIYLYMVGGANFVGTYFTVSTGTIRTNSDSLGAVFSARAASIESAGNGWYRCILTVTTAGITTVTVRYALSDGTSANYAGNGSSSLYGWGIKLEVGPDASPYIPE